MSLADDVDQLATRAAAEFNAVRGELVGQLAGSGEYPQAIGSANTVGTAGTAARSDHIHRMSDDDQALFATIADKVDDDDARLSNARTPTAHAASHATGGGDAITPAAIGASTSGHSHASYVSTSRTITAGTGLTGGGDMTANRTLTVAYGTTAGTAAQGNDARLSDARTPTTHVHSAADLTSGTLDTARMPFATSGTRTASTAGSGTTNLTISSTTQGNNCDVTVTNTLVLEEPVAGVNGQVLQIAALASGAQRTMSFGTGLDRLTGIEASYVVPSGKVLRAAIRYSTLTSGWTVEAAAVTQ